MNRRRILIIAGSSVLGQGCATALAGSSELWLTYHREPKKAVLQEGFPAARISRLDVTSPDSVAACAAEIQAAWGRVDGIVYAAGAGLLWPAAKTTDQQWSRLFEVNVLGAQRVLRSAYSLLEAGEQAAVVLISSVMGMAGAGGMAAYGASKAAVAALARELAIEWANRRIRVNAVAPGIVPSPLVNDMFKYLTPEQRATIEQKHPLGLGDAADVGAAVEFLLSLRARWITGAVLPVDGGYTAQ